MTALGFLAAGLTGGFLALLACLALGGLGSGCQHPLSSSLGSRAYEIVERLTRSSAGDQKAFYGRLLAKFTASLDAEFINKLAWE